VERKLWKILLAIEKKREAMQLDAEALDLLKEVVDEPEPPKRPAPRLQIIICNPEPVEGD